MRLRPFPGDHVCNGCGYPLNAHAVEAVCPECGRDAGRRRDGRSSQAASERTVLFGTLLMAPCCGFTIALIIGWLRGGGPEHLWWFEVPVMEQYVLPASVVFHFPGALFAIPAYCDHVRATRSLLFRRRGLAEAMLLCMLPPVAFVVMMIVFALG